MQGVDETVHSSMKSISWRLQSLQVLKRHVQTAKEQLNVVLGRNAAPRSIVKTFISKAAAECSITQNRAQP